MVERIEVPKYLGTYLDTLRASSLQTNPEIHPNHMNHQLPPDIYYQLAAAPRCVGGRPPIIKLV